MELKRFWEAFIAGLFVAAVYLATLAGSHTEAEDGLDYSYQIGTGDPEKILSPYHLAYGWIGWAAYQVARLVGYSGGPLLPAQILNALIGALGVAVLWAFLYRTTQDRAATLLGSGIVAFSHGYWWYSVEVEVYILSAVVLLTLLIATHRALRKPSVRLFVLVGVLHGIAVLCHNTNVLFGSVVVVAFWLMRHSISGRSLIRLAAAYVLTAAGIIVAAYGAALAVVGARSRDEAVDWLTGYVQSGNWGIVGPSTVPKAIVGVGRALIGGHFLFSFAEIRNLVTRVAPDKSLREEHFLVRNVENWEALALSGLAVLLIGMLSVLVVHAVKALPILTSSGELAPRAQALVALCLAWMLPYTLFFLWWEPLNHEFWIAVWIPAAILLALGFQWSRPKVSRRGGEAMVAPVLLALLVVNLLGSVWPQHSKANDYWRTRVAWYEAQAEPNDLVVCSFYMWCNYIRYFGETSVLNIDELDNSERPVQVVAEEIIRKIEATAESTPGRILFTSEVFFPATDEYSCCRSERVMAIASELWSEFSARTTTVAIEPFEEVRELVPRSDDRAASTHQSQERIWAGQHFSPADHGVAAPSPITDSQQMENGSRLGILATSRIAEDISRNRAVGSSTKRR